MRAHKLSAAHKTMLGPLLLVPALVAHPATIPTHSLVGGGSIPMLGMGGNDFAKWIEASGATEKAPAMIQTFHGYGNGAHIAPQLQAIGREKFFVSTGIPCGCCGGDAPKVQPVTKEEATGYIEDELAQLNTSYVDLLLFHHRCNTSAETAAVWEALEEAKAQGMARHIGVSNFNAHDLSTLINSSIHEPIEVLEAHVRPPHSRSGWSGLPMLSLLAESASACPVFVWAVRRRHDGLRSDRVRKEERYPHRLLLLHLRGQHRPGEHAADCRKNCGRKEYLDLPGAVCLRSLQELDRPVDVRP